MSETVLISITGEDAVGLIAKVTGTLYELGANLADTSFSVLGHGFEFTSVSEILDEDTDQAAILEALKALPELSTARIEVQQFHLEPTAAERGIITHRITVRGGDQPGLVARLSEVFIDFHANVIRMNCRRNVTSSGTEYVTTFAVSIPENRAAHCLSAISNTAGSLRLQADWTVVEN